MRHQVEIDLIACDGDDYIIGECKWRNEKLDLSVLTELKEKADIFNKSLFTFVCLIPRQYNYTFHELRKQLENQVVQIQVQWQRDLSQHQKPLTISLPTKSFTKNTTSHQKKSTS